MRAFSAMLCAIAALGALAVTSPARAGWNDEDGWRRHEWREHVGREHEWRQRQWYGYALPMVVYAPAPTYYAPPPVYYAAPPPTVYVPPPPPVYQEAPGVSIGFSFR
jgi:hypothetical protein